MRKFYRGVVWAFVVFALTMNVVACGGGGEASKANTESTASQSEQESELESIAEKVSVEGKFAAGFARAEITPDESVPLSGYGNTLMRMSDGYLDRIYTNCLAVKDEEGTIVLIFMNDLIGAYTAATEKIAEATGVDKGLIFVEGSHTHSAPDTGQTSLNAVKRYADYLKNQMVLAAKLAIEDLAPATMSSGSVDTVGMNFVRHYLLSDGTYGGDNFGNFTNNPIVKHETDADPELQLVRFEREGAKDILIMNFQTHPHRTGGSTKYNISSDIVGRTREYVEANADVWCSYIQGASGNINSVSRIAGESVADTYQQWGQIMGDYVLDLSAKTSPISTGKIIATNAEYVGKVNHSEDYLAAIAESIRSAWAQTGNSTAAVNAGKPYNIHSPYHAGAIVTKSKLGETYSMPISVLRIGGLGFAVAPVELFDVLGMQIKNESKYEETFIMGYCNGGAGYLPAAYSYDNTSYEADTCKYEKGTGEDVVKTLLQMLEEIREK